MGGGGGLSGWAVRGSCERTCAWEGGLWPKCVGSCLWGSCLHRGAVCGGAVVGSCVGAVAQHCGGSCVRKVCWGSYVGSCGGKLCGKLYMWQGCCPAV